jgi:hypothetical protein
MSNIAGKAYAMNLVTPIRWWLVPLNKFFFWLIGTPIFRSKLRGLLTLSMIHYARWVILRPDDFPRLNQAQPPEKIEYSYMLFFSNFNGTWEQYVDSFSAAIPSGLNLLWYKNVGWPTAVPEQPFHRYVLHNQWTTDYYYSAYPMAASNDVKAAKRVKDSLCTFIEKTGGATADAFGVAYQRLLKELQNDLSMMDAAPIVSLATAAIAERRRRDGAVPSLRPRAPEPAAAAPHPTSGPKSEPTRPREQING